MNSSVNILYIDHYAGSNLHGMEFRPFLMAKRWVQAGHHVTIAASSFSHLRGQNPDLMGKKTLDETIDGVRFFWIYGNHYSGNGLDRVRNILSFVRGLTHYQEKLVGEHKPDVVIASSTYPMDIYPAAKIAKKYNARLVYEVHDLWPLTQTELYGYGENHPLVKVIRQGARYAWRTADRVAGVFVPVVMAIASIVAGAIWGCIPGLVKAFLNINEVLACIMTNWIAANLVTWLFDKGSLFENLQNHVENTKTAYTNKNVLAVANADARWTNMNANGEWVTDLAELAALNQGKTMACFDDNGAGNQLIHSWAVEDASYLKLSNITIGYTFPKQLISKIGLTKLRLYATGNNLLTWTPYTGYDPEVSTMSSQLTPGVDFGAYPKSRSFVFGVNVAF